MINVRCEHNPYDGSVEFEAINEHNKLMSNIVLEEGTEELSNWVEIRELLTRPPEVMRKGYASAVLNAACQYAFNKNKNVYLFIGIDREIGINFFKKNGFEVLCMYDPDSDNDHFKKHSDDTCFYVMIKRINADYHDLLEYLKKWSIHFGRSFGQ